MMDTHYSISPVLTEDHDSIMQLLRRTFYTDEPLNKAVGLFSSESDTCAELDEYCTHSLNEGLSFKATDEEGNVIGVIINGVCPIEEDINGNDLLSQAQKCQNPKFKRILYILAKRESGARLSEQYPGERHVVEIKVTATDHRWRKKGIMSALISETEKAIRQKGYRLVRLDTSSAYSAMAAERLGYTCKYKALYRDIKMDGQPLIVPEPPHLEDCVYIKELSSSSTN